MTLKTIEGTFIAPKGRYALVVGRFNSFVVESLVSGAVDALVRHGVSESDITIIRAPGAFEIPLVAQKVAQQGEFARSSPWARSFVAVLRTSNTWQASAPRAWPRCPWSSAYRLRSAC
jgi:hypothetical protein